MEFQLWWSIKCALWDTRSLVPLNTKLRVAAELFERMRPDLGVTSGIKTEVWSTTCDLGLDVQSGVASTPIGDTFCTVSTDVDEIRGIRKYSIPRRTERM